MTQQELYNELKELASQIGIKVRLETGDFEGGVCTVNEQRVILVNRRHHHSKRISVIARSLHEIGLDDIFVKPAVRDLIEDEVTLARAAAASKA